MIRRNSRRRQVIHPHHYIVHHKQYEPCDEIHTNWNFNVVEPDEIKFNLNDIWGYDECKKDLNILIEYLNGDKKFEKFNVLPPLKYVLTGPNGSGKSTIAMAVAKMTNLPIVVVEPSFFFNTTEMLEELEEIFNVIELHIENGQNCILLLKNIQHISELSPEISQPLTESLVRHFRNLPGLVAFATLEAGEKTSITIQLFEKPAFEKIIDLPYHELKIREKILKELFRDIPVEENIDIHRIALDVYAMSTGEIKHLIKEASLICLRKKKDFLSYEDISEAMAQMDFGYINFSLSPEDRLSTAIHEAGHVVVGYYTDPINYKPSKVDITPRSVYMGITHTTPNEDKKTFFRKDLENNIAMTLGGMAAENVYYNTTSTGVSNDIQVATIQAINIFKNFGMGSEIGPIYLLIENHKFPEIGKEADKAIQELLKNIYSRAQKIVREHREALDALANALLEKEVLYENEIIEILKKNN